jgi:hypothetical protein
MFEKEIMYYPEPVRYLALAVSLLLGACGSAPVAPRDPTQDTIYIEATRELTLIAKQATESYAAAKPDEAAAKIEEAKPLMARVLSVPHPTLAATEAAADLDDLYGRMLLANRHYGWARLMFQKNVARWRVWQPVTADTTRRLKDAQASIAECDRHIE